MIIYNSVYVISIYIYFRIKRKERYRRNYIRNTNIFYSFPDDQKDSGDSQFDNTSTGTPERDNSLILTTNALYEPFKSNSSPYRVCSEFDAEKYVIKPHNNNNTTDVVPYSEDVYPPDSSADTSNEFIDYVNDVENEIDDQCESASDRQTDIKLRVTFDPSTEYATVKKEGKTKL